MGPVVWWAGWLLPYSGYSGPAQDAQALLRMLRLSSGKSGRCSRPETKTEPAKEKVEYDYSGI